MHTGTYCHRCGTVLVREEPSLDWSPDMTGPFTVKRIYKELPIHPENYEHVHNGEHAEWGEADAYVDRNESPDNPYKYVILDGEGKRRR